MSSKRKKLTPLILCTPVLDKLATDCSQALKLVLQRGTSCKHSHAYVHHANEVHAATLSHSYVATIA